VDTVTSFQELYSSAPLFPAVSPADATSGLGFAGTQSSGSVYSSDGSSYAAPPAPVGMRGSIQGGVPGAVRSAGNGGDEPGLPFAAIGSEEPEHFAAVGDRAPLMPTGSSSFGRK
jgi:hypothetical protein